MSNAMAQVGTGNGKSIILGILSTILALMGCKVTETENLQIGYLVLW